MRRVDYDSEQFRDYARGRALTGHQLRTWIDTFRAVLPQRRPLSGVDVGSGTGRFTPALAEAFGPVTGVEPSGRMLATARAQAAHPGVRYLLGSAEDMPVPSGGADYAVLLQSWHHVRDEPRAVAELARVLRPGGRAILRSGFSDHMPYIWWLEHFPRGPEVDASMFQPLHEVVATFTAAGWRVADFRTTVEPSTRTRADVLERLRLRAHTVFALFTPDELDAGFRNLERAVAEDPDAPAPADGPAPLLTFERQ